jgi:hypothetical protein
MSSRRRFFGALAGSLAALPATLRATPRRAPRSDEWDLRWLDDLKGVHKQVFDVGPVQDGLLHVVMNWLNAHNEVYGLRDNQLNAVVGLASRGFPANANDALWAKYHIGEYNKITDPETGEWAMRNVMVHVPADAPPMVRGMTVPALVARGVIFWQCDNALHGIAAAIADATRQAPDMVYAELRANLLPHVKLVPAHTMLVGLCQEHGCTYEALG